MKNELIDTIKDQELKEALTQLRTKKRGRPKHKIGVTSCPDNLTRVCLNVPTEKINKIREIAFLDTKLIKNLVEEGLDYVINNYELKHGTVVPDPSHIINVRKL